MPKDEDKFSYGTLVQLRKGFAEITDINLGSKAVVQECDGNTLTLRMDYNAAGKQVGYRKGVQFTCIKQAWRPCSFF